MAYHSDFTHPDFDPNLYMDAYDDSPSQLQREAEEMEHADCLTEFGPHDDHTECQSILANMNSTFVPWQDGDHNWNWT